MLDLSGDQIIVSAGALGMLATLAFYVGQKTKGMEQSNREAAAAAASAADSIASVARLTNEHCVRINTLETKGALLRDDHDKLEGRFNDHVVGGCG